MRRIIALPPLVVALLAVSTHAQDQLPSAPAGQTWKLVWQDEFDGDKIDATKWDIPEYKRRDGHWSRKAISLDGQGHLVMSVLKDGDKYLDGCVRTKDKFQHSFGYYVARIQLQKQLGHWSAFWIMGDGVSTAPFRYPYYHTLEDTVDKIDFEKLARVVRGLDGVVAALVNRSK